MFKIVRLLGSILLEGVVNVFHIFWFLVRRGAVRQRIRALILERPVHPTEPADSRNVSLSCGGGRDAAVSRASVALLVALSLGLAGPAMTGCASSPLETHRQMNAAPIPGTSFQRQLDETALSARWLADMSDAQQSLEYSFEAFGSGVSPETGFEDLRAMMTDPKMQQSWEETLEEFGKSDPRAVEDTFTMWGW